MVIVLPFFFVILTFWWSNDCTNQIKLIEFNDVVIVVDWKVFYYFLRRFVRIFKSWYLLVVWSHQKAMKFHFTHRHHPNYIIMTFSLTVSCALSEIQLLSKMYSIKWWVFVWWLCLLTIPIYQATYIEKSLFLPLWPFSNFTLFVHYVIKTQEFVK